MANCSTRPVELPVLDVLPVEEFLLVCCQGIREFLRWGVLLDLRAPGLAGGDSAAFVGLDSGLFLDLFKFFGLHWFFQF